MRIRQIIVNTILIVLVNLFSLLFTQTPNKAGTEARIIEEKGNTWTLDKGIHHGVTMGLEGFLMKKTYSPREKKYVYHRIAHFKVSKVMQELCWAKVDKWTGGFAARDAQYAQFIKRLVPPTGIKTKSRKIKEKIIETGKTTRWYLKKGDDAEKLEKYDLALDYYYKVLEKTPDEPGAKFKIRITKGKYFVQQGNLDYKNQEYFRAYEYYIMAFQILGENDFIAAEKIIDLWDEDEQFYDKTKEFEISPLVVMESLTGHCTNLLTENRLEELAALAHKMKNHAKDDQLRNKLDTYMSAKEILADVEKGDYNKMLATVETAVDEANLFKAAYVIDILDNLAVADDTKTKLAELKEKLRGRKSQVQMQRAVKLKEEKIDKLKEEAAGFIALKNYGEAIKRYTDMYKLEPDKKEISDKIAELQLKKFNYEKSQKEIKAGIERDNLILYAKDYFQKELMQDALDYYIKAYKILPEEGKAVAGAVTVLENCSADDAKFITTDLLQRKLSKFTKDFLNYIKKEYLGKTDEKGFEILSKTIFISNNKQFDDLMTGFKANLYGKNLELGHQQFKAADFNRAAELYLKAQTFKDTPEIKDRLAVCAEVEKMKKMLELQKKKELNTYFTSLSAQSPKYDIMEGLLNLGEKYMEESNFKRAKYLYKKVAGFQIYKFKTRISDLKKKEKELKKKAKAARK
ncbi:MAG: hypothetical protein GY950_24125 [bacterium]|nr:hypothetical protein [bacterium]